MMINTYTAFFIVTWITIIGLILLIFTVIELVLSKNEIDKYYEEKKETELKGKFQKILEKVKIQETKEILECLLEMENLDRIYREIRENEYEFIDETTYLKIKEDTIDDIITAKINETKNNKEKIKSLIDEIDSCRERYPEYNEIFIKNINKLKKKKQNIEKWYSFKIKKCKKMSKKQKKLENTLK